MSIGQFRSTAAFAPRVRTSAVAIDRATFVIFSIGGHRFAAPVERVERVLRVDAALPSATYGGQTLPLADLAASLGLARAPSTLARVLVFSDGSSWVAAVVDVVHEVVTIDASLVAPLACTDALTYVPLGARGVFSRLNEDVIVLDVTRALGAGRPYARPDDADSIKGDQG